MVIKTYISRLHIKKLWVEIFIAVAIAAILIVYSLIKVLNGKNDMIFDNFFNSLQKNELFNMTSYCVESQITVVSNKNRNVYNISEWYKRKDDQNEYFKFNIKSNQGSITSYIFKDNVLQVKNSDQESIYLLKDYVIKKTNIMSFATFVSLYNDINKYQLKNCTIQEQKNNDNTITIKINFNDINKLSEENNEFYQKYKELFDYGIKLKTIQVIIDSNKSIPLSMSVSNNKNEIWIDIDYINFKINEEFDDNIFDF